MDQQELSEVKSSCLRQIYKDIKTYEGLRAMDTINDTTVMF